MADIVTTVITNSRRKKLCQLTSGAISSFPPVAFVAFGDGGVGEDGVPKAPTGNQTALFNEIGRYPIDAVEYPQETTARYLATIPKEDLIGKQISEAALVDADGDFCAIKTMYAKGKDEDVIFTFVFDDEF